MRGPQEETIDPSENFSSLLGSIVDLEADAVPELLQTAHESAAQAVLVQPVEIVRAKILEPAAVLQHAVDDDQDAVRHRDRGRVGTVASAQPAILRRQIAGFGPPGRFGRLDERPAEPPIALPGLSRLALSRAFIVAGTELGPRRAVPGGREVL